MSLFFFIVGNLRDNAQVPQKILASIFGKCKNDIIKGFSHKKSFIDEILLPKICQMAFDSITKDYLIGLKIIIPTVIRISVEMVANN